VGGTGDVTCAAEMVRLCESYSQVRVVLRCALRVEQFVSSVFHRRQDLCGRYDLNFNGMDSTMT
jgi:hypothetical protein